MTHTEAKTYTAAIYVAESMRGHAWLICSQYCREVGLCVTVTPTTFIYTGGCEAGVAIGLINYPRFPVTPEALRETAVRLAELLVKEMCQRSASVVFPDTTIWIQNTEIKAP